MQSQQSRRLRLSTWSRRGLAVVVVVVGLVVGIVALWRHWPSPTSCVPSVDGSTVVTDRALVVTFGSSRSPKVREQSVRLPRAALQRAKARARGSEVLAVQLAGDLRSVTDPREELPSAQVTVGSTRINNKRVSITAAVDPGQPEQVAAGCYTGTVLVNSNGAKTVMPMVVDLGSREGARAVAAFLLLLVGAGLGLTIKWITESLTPLAAQGRRLDRLKAALRLEELPDEVLPVGAQVLLDEAEDRIERNDIAGLDTQMQPLEQHRAELITLASTIGRFKRKMEAHEALATSHWGGLPDSARRLLVRLVALELDRIEEIRQVPWPEEPASPGTATLGPPADDATAMIERYRRDLQVIEDAVELLTREPASGRVAAVFVQVLSGNFEKAHSILASQPSDDGADGAALPSASVSGYVLAGPDVPLPGRPSRRRQSLVMSWMLGHARMFAALASVLVVALIGLQLQYLDPVGFDDGLGSWLKLFLWALAVELSGVSVLDVVARLGSAGSGTSTRPS